MHNLIIIRKKNGTEATVDLSSVVIGDSIDGTNFPNKSLLTDRQVSRLCKAFGNNLSANITLSKTRLSETVKSGGFLGRLLNHYYKLVCL